MQTPKSADPKRGSLVLIGLLAAAVAVVVLTLKVQTSWKVQESSAPVAMFAP